MHRAGHRVGLLHHVGGGNLGDDATQDAVSRNIKKRWPDVELIGLSMTPEDSEKRHGIRTFAIRRQRWTFGYAGGRGASTVNEKVMSTLVKNRFVYGLIRVMYRVAIRIPRTSFEEFAFLYRSYRIVKAWMS